MIRHAWVLIAVCAPLLGFARQPESFSSENVVEEAATVMAVNEEARTLVLQDSDAVRTLIVAGPEVRNFDQIEVGDNVVARYRQAILAEVKPKSGGTGTTAPEGMVTSTRAAPGQRPAAGMAASISTTVAIESVDTSFDTVTFRRPDGIVRVVAVEDPEASKFIRDLRKGDVVQVTYTEAIALAVTPAKQ